MVFLLFHDMKNTSIDSCSFHGLRAHRLALADGSTAVITQAGAHLVSWCTADGAEQLYLSPRSPMAVGQAIRGGVPVVFPQFSTRGDLVRHGFARTSEWEFLASECTPDSATVRLALQGAAGAHGGWPHAFACTISVSLQAGGLALELEVSNRGKDAMRFAAALHTYLRVHSLADTQLSGLQDCWYEDANDGCQRKRDTQSALVAQGAVDRIYLQTPAALQLTDGRRTLALESAGFTDTVVWNPAQAGNAKIADLPPGAYQEFLCVEAAVIDSPVQLPPGQTWTGTQQLTLL